MIFATCSSSICLQVFLLCRGISGRDSLNGDSFTLGFLQSVVSSNQDYTVLRMAFLEADSSFFLGGTSLKGPIFLGQFTFNDAVFVLSETHLH